VDATEGPRKIAKINGKGKRKGRRGVAKKWEKRETCCKG